MKDIFGVLGHYVHFYPFAALVGLLLAGLNIPVSEDLVIITGALVTQGAPYLLVPSLLAIYAGVIIRDFMAYFIGVFIRKGTVKIRFAAFSSKNLDMIKRHLDKHGFLTFIVCRFIPFGVRNTLFMASGFFGLPLRRFILYDVAAAAISTNTLFFLVYNFGDEVRNPLRVAGIILFILLSAALLTLTVRFLIGKKIHFPLTAYGLPQVVIFPVLTGAVMAALFFTYRPSLWLIPPEILRFLILSWMLSFFRNPRRKIVPDESVLLSPADGKVTDISVTEDSALGRVLRIGIFLSIFNVHLNRVPCSVRIDKISYKRGMFKDARSPESSRVNESNTLLMTRLSEPQDRMLVRQISGAIARHIVCGAKEEDQLPQGELFGMIKFGSRTELYIPAEDGKYTVLVKAGDSVRAGSTPLVRYL
jgi:phosphatidylserine decarboxylase